MVSVAPFLRDAELIFDEIQERENKAERHRRLEFFAVRAIQRWVRGFLERQHIAKLNNAATTIQRCWRGFCGRKFYTNLLKREVEDMTTRYYNNMATVIQRWWRGYVVRTYQYNHISLKTWLKLVMAKNLETLHDIRHFRKKIEMSEIDALENEAKEWVLFILFKIHHMLRTRDIPGIYSRLETNELTMLEQQLKDMRFTDYVDILHRQRQALRLRFENAPPPQLPPCVTHRNCNQYWYKRIRVNTPILAAQEKYRSLGELYEKQNIERGWIREMERKGMKFPRIKYNDKQLLMRHGVYDEACLPLRDKIPSKWVASKDFNTLIRRIELFDELKHFNYFGPFRPMMSETEMLSLGLKPPSGQGDKL